MTRSARCVNPICDASVSDATADRLRMTQPGRRGGPWVACSVPCMTRYLALSDAFSNRHRLEAEEGVVDDFDAFRIWVDYHGLPAVRVVARTLYPRSIYPDLKFGDLSPDQMRAVRDEVLRRESEG